MESVRLCLVFMCLLGAANGRLVTQEMEDKMRDFIKDMIDMMVDSDGVRFMVPGIIRTCFHDCIEKCDGCIDMRRKVQATNNGIENTWKPLRQVYFNRFAKFCSLADFLALACAVATEYSAQLAEEQGVCERNPFSFENDCQPKVEVRWGRQSCDHAQLIPVRREIPDTDQNPYEWFDENMNFEPRQIVCIMGSHSLGRLRRNETGFDGNFTVHPELLDNEYYKRMLDSTVTWQQKEVTNDVDGEPTKRFQWEIGQDDLVRTNSDMMLLYEMKPNKKGKVNCKTAGSRARMPVCKQQEHRSIVEEMANDNKAFLRCFGEAMTALTQMGYEEGALVPTGVEYTDPPPPPDTTTTQQPTTTTKRQQTRRQRNQNRQNRRRVGRRRNNGRRNNGGRIGFTSNTLRNRFFPSRTSLILS